MTTHEFAASYVREHYDERLEDEPVTEQEKDRLRELIARETERLHVILVRACDAWATDADIFELED